MSAGSQRMPSGVPTLTQLSPAPFKQSAVKHRKQTFPQQLQKLTDTHLLLGMAGTELAVGTAEPAVAGRQIIGASAGTSQAKFRCKANTMGAVQDLFEQKNRQASTSQ